MTLRQVAYGAAVILFDRYTAQANHGNPLLAYRWLTHAGEVAAWGERRWGSEWWRNEGRG